MGFGKLGKFGVASGGEGDDTALVVSSFFFRFFLLLGLVCILRCRVSSSDLLNLLNSQEMYTDGVFLRYGSGYVLFGVLTSETLYRSVDIYMDGQ